MNTLIDNSFKQFNLDPEKHSLSKDQVHIILADLMYKHEEYEWTHDYFNWLYNLFDKDEHQE